GWSYPLIRSHLRYASRKASWTRSSATDRSPVSAKARPRTGSRSRAKNVSNVSRRPSTCDRSGSCTSPLLAPHGRSRESILALPRSLAPTARKVHRPTAGRRMSRIRRPVSDLSGGPRAPVRLVVERRADRPEADVRAIEVRGRDPLSIVTGGLVDGGEE